MLIRVSNDLSRQEIWAEGDELVNILGMDRDERGEKIYQRPYTEKKLVAVIENPILLTDVPRISKLDSTERDTIVALYGSYPRTIEYDGVSVWWNPNNHRGVWCPSIDTLVFANAARGAGNVLSDEVESAVDIGCGSGFLGKYFLHKCRNLKELHLVDLSKNAVACANDNVQRLHEDQIVTFSVGDGRKLAGKKFDRVICNPPYVPRPRSIADNPYEGVNLLHDIIVDGKNYLNEGGILLINASSLSEEIKNLSVKQAKICGLKSVQEIGRKNVPLKVNPILNNKEWMEYLTTTVGLKKDPHDGYDYWHEIRIYKLLYE